MKIIGISINHRTAPVKVRENLTLSKDEIIKFIPNLKEDLLASGFVLSTCNRTEIFGVPADGDFIHNQLIERLIEFKPVEGIGKELFNKYFSCSAVRHIFSVAAGIDSMIIGDSQILGQTREAFLLSEEMNFVDPVLKRVFDATLKVGKRAIKETAIGEGAVSVSYAAVQVVEKIFSNLEAKEALVIGAGETAELAAVHLRDKGIGSITITNRTLEKAVALSEKVHGFVLPFDQYKENLHKFDVIVSATSATNYLIEFADVKAMMKKRRGSPAALIDIAVPRDIDPKAAKIENVFYNDIDSLNQIVDANIKKRQAEIPTVQNIILEEMNNLLAWYNTLEIVPTIKGVRSFFEEIRRDELIKIKHKVTEEDYAKIEDMTRRLIGRLLHNPTIKLRELSENNADHQVVLQYALILQELFKLNDSNNSEE